ncbi:MAG: hypothetical protein OCC46_07570 [Pseudodesulfovibrio sp.]
MGEHNHIHSDDKEILKLTKWELENLHLPPVTTITLYEGVAPVHFLRHRLALIFEKNPWLTSRIVKKNTTDSIVSLAYSKTFELESTIDQYFTVYEPGDLGFSLSLPYETLVDCLLPTQCVRSKPATDEDEPLFKVSVVPIESEEVGDNEATPLHQAITLPGFALVVSMNHTLGDGHTYYKLYGMLSSDTDVVALAPVRVADFEEAKIEVIGEKENAMFTSAGLGLGIMGTYLGGKLTRREPQNICVHAVDSAWVAQEKAKAKQEGQVPFISTNDALTSWFFHTMKSDLNIMVANFRSRKPSILGLNDNHAGNYEANIPYFPGDVENPSLIRQSISDVDSMFRAMRAGSPSTEIPNFLTLVRNRSALITNWATFYRDVVLMDIVPDNETSSFNPKLHLPIMEPDGIITSVWNNAIIFRPRASELGILIITRHFNSDMLTQLKAEKGSDVPLGARII